MLWITGDYDSRKQLIEAVDSTIGNTNGKINGLPNDISNLVVDYLEELQCFGESAWTTLLGRVDPAPPLPAGFSDIWNGPCPICPEKKIRETHILVYIPSTVDGEPFTLHKLGQIAKRFFPKSDSIHRGFSDNILDLMGNKSINPCWVLTPKDVLPESIGKYYKQKEIIERLSEKCLVYEVPGLLEVATSILTQYFDLRTLSFNPNKPIYTKFTSKIMGVYIFFGGFTSDGLGIDVFYVDRGNTGIVPMRKL